MYWRFHALSPFALIESGSNPADSASRGLKPTELKKTKEWLNGPEFLRDEEDTWQKNPDEIKRMADEHLEWRRNVQVNQVLAEKSNLTTNDFLEYYSNWYALQKGVAWLLRFISFLKQRRQKMKTIPGQLTVTEIRTATVRIVKYLQRQQFPDELKILPVEASAGRSPHCYFKGGVVKGSKLDIFNPIDLSPFK
jgi:hypothetical protein